MDNKFLLAHPKFDAFIRKAGLVISPALETIGAVTGVHLLSAVGQAIDKFELPDGLKQEAKDILKAEMADNNELDGLILADRANAREREIKIATSDNSPLLNKIMLPLLAIGVTIGFFGLLIYMIHWEVPAGNKDILFTLLGSLGSVWIGITNYYFSSSIGSKQKDSQIASLINK